MALRDLKFEVASKELTWVAAEAGGQGEREIALNLGVTGCSAGHGDGADAVEFVAQGLPFLPLEELGERNGFAQGKVHWEPVLIMNWGWARRIGLGRAAVGRQGPRRRSGGFSGAMKSGAHPARMAMKGRGRSEGLRRLAAGYPCLPPNREL